MPLSRTQASRYAVLSLAIAALLLPIAWIEHSVLQYTHGVMTYPLDDTFIHMAVAKNLAFEKVWGITRYSFESASSSLLYTILLAATFSVFGAHVIIPLVINLLAAILLLAILQQWLIRQGLSLLNQFFVLLAVIYLTPLPVLVISGMEHTLQFLFCFLFISSFSAAAARATPAINGVAVPATTDRTAAPAAPAGATAGKLPWQVYLYGLLMVATRYESLAIIGLAGLILLVQRRWMAVLWLGLISIAPVVLFGLISLSKGSYLLPNSVLLKSGAPPLTFAGLSYFFTHVFFQKLFFPTQGYNLMAAQRLLLILPVFYLLFLGTLRRHPKYRNMLLILMGATLAHLAFSFYCAYPRYEAYLIGCSTVILCAIAAKHGREVLAGELGKAVWLTAALLFTLAAPVGFRAIASFRLAGQACENVYDQQYQMARFVHQYYNNTPLAFNDIGAISYFSDGQKLDLYGIGSIEVAKSKKQNTWTAGWADSLSKRDRIKIAIVYDSWFWPALLHHWSKIASWRIYNNVGAAEDSVSFYAVDTAGGLLLRKNLQAWQPSLPKGVGVRIY